MASSVPGTLPRSAKDFWEPLLEWQVWLLLLSLVSGLLIF